MLAFVARSKKQKPFVSLRALRGKFPSSPCVSVLNKSLETGADALVLRDRSSKVERLVEAQEVQVRVLPVT
jgi:hypothetical protein